jgi:hypothetical protein
LLLGGIADSLPIVAGRSCRKFAMSGQSSRQMVVDEMFPDGPGNLDYVDAEDGVSFSSFFAVLQFQHCFVSGFNLVSGSGFGIRIRIQED